MCSHCREGSPHPEQARSVSSFRTVRKCDKIHGTDRKPNLTSRHSARPPWLQGRSSSSSCMLNAAPPRLRGGLSTMSAGARAKDWQGLEESSFSHQKFLAWSRAGFPGAKPQVYPPPLSVSTSRTHKRTVALDPVPLWTQRATETAQTQQRLPGLQLEQSPSQVLRGCGPPWPGPGTLSGRRDRNSLSAPGPLHSWLRPRQVSRDLDHDRQNTSGD